MMRPIKTTLSLARFFTVRYFRDKVALFFTFVFPIMFLVIFGFIFGGENTPSFNVALINNSDTPFSKQFVEQAKSSEVFKITETSDFDTAKLEIERGEKDAIIELPASFGKLNAQKQPTGTVVTYNDQSDEQLNATLSTVMQGTIDGINAGIVKTQAPIKLEAKSLQTANLSRFDYLIAGIIGFSLLSLGIFSMSEGFTGDKKNGSLRRMEVAPLKPWNIIIATGINRVLVGLVSVAALFVVAIVIFDFQMRGDYLSFILFTIISTFCLFGFGMAIAGWAKDGNQSAPIANLVTFPMMFLSGVFFPVFLMPQWLQNISAFIPLTPIVDGLRMILTEGKTIIDLGPQLAVIGVWTLIIYVIAFRVFRWE